MLFITQRNVIFELNFDRSCEQQTICWTQIVNAKVLHGNETTAPFNIPNIWISLCLTVTAVIPWQSPACLRIDRLWTLTINKVVKVHLSCHADGDLDRHSPVVTEILIAPLSYWNTTNLRLEMVGPFYCFLSQRWTTAML